MTDKVYKEILKPLNRCNLTGIESVIKSERFNNLKIIITKDNYNQTRAVLIDVSNNSRIVSAILFDQFRIVRFKYTEPDYRGNNYTKQLFAFTELTVKRKFYHSDNLTEAGEKSI